MFNCGAVIRFRLRTKRCESEQIPPLCLKASRSIFAMHSDETGDLFLLLLLLLLTEPRFKILPVLWRQILHRVSIYACFCLVFFTSFSFKHTPISITLMDRTHQNALISRSYRWHCHRSAVLPCHGTTKREAGVQNEPLLSEMFCCFSYQKEQVSKLGAVWKCRVFFSFRF